MMPQNKIPNRPEFHTLDTQMVHLFEDSEFVILTSEMLHPHPSPGPGPHETDPGHSAGVHSITWTQYRPEMSGNSIKGHLRC